jgi:hypothetical protein
MLLRLLTTPACVLFIFSISVAQKDFRPGYVVKDGDTLKGLVRYGGKRPSEAAVFKSGKHDKAVDYTTGEVSAYGIFGDKQFEAIDIGTSGAARKAFAIALEKGEIDLYYTKGRYMLIKEANLTVLDRKPDSVAEIKNKYGEKKGRAVIKDIRYIDQLNMLISSDCGLNANNTQFSRRQISALIGKYNKCKNNYIDLKDTKPLATIGASLAFGGYGSTLELDSLHGYKFKADAAPVLQVDFEVRFPRLTDRITLALGLQPVKSTYHATTIVTSTTQTRQDDLTLKVRYLKIPLSIKYNFGSPGNSLFVRAGAWKGVLNDELNFTTHRTFKDNNTNETHTNDLNVPNGYRNPGGAMLGVGYDKNIIGRLRVFGEFRYEANTGFIGGPVSPTSGFSFMSVLLGVGF